MENTLPYTIHYFTKFDEEIYNFWLYFNKDEENGVRVVGMYKDAMDRAYSILDKYSYINIVTCYNDKLDNFSFEINRNW